MCVGDCSRACDRQLPAAHPAPTSRSAPPRACRPELRAQATGACRPARALPLARASPLKPWWPAAVQLPMASDQASGSGVFHCVFEYCRSYRPRRFYSSTGAPSCNRRTEYCSPARPPRPPVTLVPPVLAPQAACCGTLSHHLRISSLLLVLPGARRASRHRGLNVPRLHPLPKAPCETVRCLHNSCHGRC